MSSTTKKIHLILTGASGYLGQHLLSHWIREGVIQEAESNSVQFYITALYHTSETFPENAKAFLQKNTHHPSILEVVVSSMDLTNPSQSDIESLLSWKNASVVVVHSAALSSPRACQANPEQARAINVPTKLLDALLDANASVVALSTDQVYDGRQAAGSYYQEDETDGLNPVNVYGQTKLELEKYLIEKGQPSSPLLAALRSSIILGPKAPIDPGCAHGTFLDFCRSRGEDQEATTFYTNEYRTVVRVDTVIQTIAGFVVKSIASSSSSSSIIYNMGGPVRVNRMELAKAVFEKFGYDEKLLIEAEQTSPMSPLDISMDSSRLVKEGILQQRKDITVFLKELVDYVFDQ